MMEGPQARRLRTTGWCRGLSAHRQLSEADKLAGTDTQPTRCSVLSCGLQEWASARMNGTK